MSNGDEMVSEGSPVHSETEAELVAKYVDQDPRRNEAGPDEEAVLDSLYGDVDSDGVYRGDDVA